MCICVCIWQIKTFPHNIFKVGRKIIVIEFTELSQLFTIIDGIKYTRVFCEV